MRAKLLQVVWHSKDPVYSLDFHPSGLLATGGGDKEVKLWQLAEDEAGDLTVTHEASLGGHAKMVNCVRFSPTGEQLATSGDGGEVFLWKPSKGGTAAFGAEPGTADPGWKLSVSLRGGHADDVIDLSWAPDSSALLSGSIENVCVVWDVEKGKGQGRLTEHCHYVQGVAWDPARIYVVSQSADRTCRVYGPRVAALGKKTKHMQSSLALAKDFICQSIISKRQMPRGTSEGKLNKIPMFHDENMSFFRRPAWSPEGSMLVLPAGIHKESADDEGVDAAYVYARGQWNAPVLVLPATKPVVAVRFCPVLFEVDEGLDAQDSPFELPYKMVWAVASMDSVMLYDTSGQAPFAVLGSLHPDRAPITDLAWSCNGRYLATSSIDGFCSVAEFAEGDLGTRLHANKTPPHIAAYLNIAAKAVAPFVAEPKITQAATPVARAPTPEAQAFERQPVAAARPAALAAAQHHTHAPARAASGLLTDAATPAPEQQTPQAPSAPKRSLEAAAPASDSAPAEQPPSANIPKKQRRIAPTALPPQSAVAPPSTPQDLTEGGAGTAGSAPAAAVPAVAQPVSASKPPVPPREPVGKPIHPFLQPRTAAPGPSSQQRLTLASTSTRPTSSPADVAGTTSELQAPGQVQPATSASFTTSSTVREAQRAEMRRIGLESPAASVGQATSGMRPPTPRRIHAQLIGSATSDPPLGIHPSVGKPVQASSTAAPGDAQKCSSGAGEGAGKVENAGGLGASGRTSEQAQKEVLDAKWRSLEDSQDSLDFAPAKKAAPRRLQAQRILMDDD